MKIYLFLLLSISSFRNQKVYGNELKPYLRVFRGISKTNLPGYLGFFQFLRNFHQLTAFEQAEMILYAALDPSIASKAKKGEFVKCLDHFDLLQSARN